MEKELIVLPHSEQWQEAIVGHMFNDSLFFLKCISTLEHTWFVNPIVSTIFKYTQKFYESEKRSPTIEEIKGIAQRYNPVSMDDQRKYYDMIDLCKMSSKNIGLDIIAKDMTGWIRLVKFKEAIIEASDIYNKKQYDKAIDWTDQELKKIKKITFMEDESIKFSDAADFFAKRELEFADCCTIGHPLFDSLLREESLKDKLKFLEKDMDGKEVFYHNCSLNNYTSGGLVKGDTTIILGPSNSGKTTTVITIIAANVWISKDVLYITHEQKWEDIKTKMLSNMLGLREVTLRDPDKEVQDKLRLNGGFIDKHLTYLPWVKAGDMYVESVIEAVNSEQAKKISRDGKGYDLLVVDYPGKLKSKRFGSKTALWEELDYVYDQFVTSALEHRFHAILPVQSNREGYRVNMGDHSDNRLLDQGDVGGSFGVMQKASNVITLNRSPRNCEDQIMKFHLAKCRTAKTGSVFCTSTDFALSKTHGPNLRSGVYTSEAFKGTTDETLAKVFGKKSSTPTSYVGNERGAVDQIFESNLKSYENPGQD